MAKSGKLAVFVFIMIVVAGGLIWGATRLIHKPTIEFIPMGIIDKSLVEEIAKKTAEIFGATCLIDDAISVPQNAFNPKRRQYLVYTMVNAVPPVLKSGAPHRLAITEVDMYAPDAGFYFSYWNCPNRRAVLSIARLRPENYRGGTPNHTLLVKRGVTEAAHQIAHTYGLQHCSTPGCIMTQSDSVIHIDTKNEAFCDSCKQRVKDAIRNQ